MTKRALNQRSGKPSLTSPPFSHYANDAERSADSCIHIVGVAAAMVGGPILITIAKAQGGSTRALAVLIYVLCLIAMLAVSAVYNLIKDIELQKRLRRADHAVIFLMIAGSYTPFTTQRFEPAWALGMTVAVWTIALCAAAGKLFMPGVSKRLWLVAYVLLGWIVIVAMEPMIKGVRPLALILLGVGGAIYTLGVLIYASHRLPFRRAIWHGFVLAAASAHYAAILIGVAGA